MKDKNIVPKVVLVERWVWLKPGLHDGRSCFCCKYYKAKAARLANERAIQNG